MTFQRLTRQFTQLFAGVKAQIPPERVTLQFQIDVFPVEERKRLRAFLDVVKPKYAWRTENNFLDLRSLSDEERDSLRLWARLQDAITRSDQAQCLNLRHWLAYGMQQTISDFLALDESLVPADLEQSIKYVEEHVLHHFYREHLTFEKEMLRRSSEQHGQIWARMDDCRRWLELFAPGHKPFARQRNYL